MRKIQLHYPEKYRSQSYMDAWLRQDPPPANAPEYGFFSHDYCAEGCLGHSFHDTLERTRRDAPGNVRQVFVIKKRKAKASESQPISGPPLQPYVNFRRAQGLTEEQAVIEWNGAQVASASA